MMDSEFAMKLAELDALGEPAKRDLWEHIKANGGMKRVAALVVRGAGKRKPRAPALFDDQPKRATRWPTDKAVPSDWLDSAAARRAKMGLPTIDLRMEAENFITYWPSVPGSKGCKIDWKLTFENSCLRARAPLEPYSRFAVIAGGKEEFEDANPQGWLKRLEIFHGLDEGVAAGTWPVKRWGPQLGEKGCLVPARALEMFENAHGRKVG